ncbi:Precorrin-6A reductase [Beijerinckiaceae bacterium RH AL1]|nr:Precorrin-6A reductase [Beijerinckiaceae bacterium RH CH11]VVB45195.1 Precorrin-6A reductase [Beijerinckiaceae bacterium RH AL8]VVC54702.1 Precorrin-6A reductase [Beijerinckiaceae bacterium RH AL1]
MLGGTSEATALAEILARRPEIEATLSLAGRTSAPAAQALPTRVGGFGGAAGLAAHIAAHRVAVLVDATHPFATAISRNAREAAATAGIPLVAVGRPPWRPQAGDDWREVADVAAAAAALGAAPRRVFLTIGRQQLAAFAGAPQHHYLVRSVDPVDAQLLPDARWIEARGPFDADAEEALMRAEGIEVLVTKNSGGTATAAKLAAARRLGLPVILVRRPTDEATLGVEDAMTAIDAHLSALRGV